MARTIEPDLEINPGFSLTISRDDVGSANSTGRDKFAGLAPVDQ